MACGHRECQLVRRCFAHSDAYGYGHTDSYGYPDCDYYAYRNRYTDGHGYSYAYCNRNPDGYSYAYCNRNPDGYSYGYCNRNRDGNSKRNSYSDTAPNRNTEINAITKGPTDSYSAVINTGSRLVLMGAWRSVMQ